MATLNDFNANNEEDVIVDPNLARRQTQNAMKPIPDAKGMRAVDPVKDLGFKSDEEVSEERAVPDDITEALNEGIAKAAVRKKREIDAFNETLEDCGGVMTEEDLAVTAGVDYLDMLSNPPDPLNRELKEFNEAQRKRMMETASPEELAAMGMAETPIKNDNVVPMPVAESEPVSDIDEDEDILREMDMEADDYLGVDSSAKSQLQAATEKATASKEVEKDDIPVYEEVEEPIYQPADIKEAGKNADVSINVPNSIPDTSDVNLDEEMAALEDDDEDHDEQVKFDEKMEKAREEIRSKVIPFANNVGIQGFKLINKPVTIDNSINMAKRDHPVRTGMWVLPSTGVPIVMEEFSGVEIDEISRTLNSGDNTVHGLMTLYRPIYNHIVSPKPATLEEWMKVVSVMDIKHLYGCIYKASFDGINFLPYDCTNELCKDAFITDSIPFDSMIDYKDDAAKKKVMEIYHSNPSIDKYHTYKSELVPISNVYAMSFKEPSIYDAIIAPAYLEDEWYEKMKDLIAISTYVDKIYVIDQENEGLRPLYIKEWPNDPKKTIKAKALALAKITKTFSSDQYSLLSSYIEKINNDSSFFEYQLPEVYCPKCKTKIPARLVRPADMLFMRHRLTSLANG